MLGTIALAGAGCSDYLAAHDLEMGRQLRDRGVSVNIRHPFRRCVTASCLALAIAGLGTASSQAAPRQSATWGIARVLGQDNYWNEVASVSAVSQTDVWFAGFTCLEQPCRLHGFAFTSIFVEHWNGHRLQSVAIPRKLAYGNNDQVLDIRATSARDAWVFGKNARGRFWMLHWDGKQWTRAPIPAFTASPMVFHGDLIWTFSSTTRSIEVKHPGHHWHAVKLSWIPETATALAANDVWALGQDTSGKYLLAHWNGRRWQSVQITAAGQARNIAADSSSDVWVDMETPGDSSGVFYQWSDGHFTAHPADNFTYQNGAPMASDGLGGMWVVIEEEIAEGGSVPGQCFEEYTDTLDFTGPVPTGPTDTANVDAMVNVPGTTSEWAVGYERPKGAAGTLAVIWSAQAPASG
jgi:hypothetical protein